MKVHLHSSADRIERTFRFAIEVPPIDGRPPKVVIWGEGLYVLDAEHTRRLRRPIYVSASYFIHGPVQARAGVPGHAGGAR